MTLNMLRWSILALTFLSMWTLIAVLASVQVPPVPRLGHRGSQRRRAMADSAVLRAVEPLIRLVCGWVAVLPMRRLRTLQERALVRASHPLGLTADENIALSVLSGRGLSSTTGAILWAAGKGPDIGPIGVAAGLLFGLALPNIHLRETAQRRAKEIARALPQAIEVAAMCMGAGLDFPGALRLVLQSRGRTISALAEELSRVLDELDLGHTRSEALRSFAGRVPSEAVRDFANAVIQAEQKGNPLARVLQIQGRMLNMRRSVAAEEAAARAGVMMIVPMVLLVACIMLLLIGPFIVRGAGL